LAEARELGFKVLINGVALMAVFERLQQVLRDLAATGEARQPLGGPLFRELLDTLGAEEVLEFDRAYKA